MYACYHVPPLTFPLVAMADVERPVIPVIQEDNKMINQVIPDEGQFRENVTDINLRLKKLGVRGLILIYLFQLEQ